METLNTLINTLNTLTNEANEANEAKISQRELTFTTIVNNQIEIYTDMKNISTMNFTAYINNAIDNEINEDTLPSIVSLLELIRYTLLTSEIKHAIITFASAKKLYKYSNDTSKAMLNSIISLDTKIYNDNITALITKIDTDKLEQLKKDNASIQKSVEKLSLSDMEVLQVLLKAQIKQAKIDNKETEKLQAKQAKQAKLNAIKQAKIDQLNAELLASA